MYKGFKKEDWLKKLGIKEEEIPDGLLLYGIMNANEGIEWFERYTGIKPELWLMHNIYRLNFKNKRIALAIAYGSPMTSELVHIFSILGTKIVIQVGSFGGLQKGMHVGDILLPTQAVRADGASDWYLPKRVVPTANGEIVDWLREECRKRNAEHHTGTIFTTTAMLAETPELIQRWSNKGYLGVDLETATTLSVAQYFGTKRAAILYLADNIIEGGHILDVSDEEERLKQEGKKIVFNAALEAVANFTA